MTSTSLTSQPAVFDKKEKEIIVFDHRRSIYSLYRGGLTSGNLN